MKKYFPIAQFDSKGKNSELVSLVDARDTSLMPGVEQNSRSKVDTFLFIFENIIIESQNGFCWEGLLKAI